MMIDDHDDNNFDFDNDEVWLGWPKMILPLIIFIIMIMRMQTLMMTMTMLHYDDHIIISSSYMMMTSFPMNANHVLISFLSPFPAVEHSWTIIVIIVIIITERITTV